MIIKTISELKLLWPWPCMHGFNSEVPLTVMQMCHILFTLDVKLQMDNLINVERNGVGIIKTLRLLHDL